MSAILTIIVIGLAAFGALCLYILWHVYLLVKEDKHPSLPGIHP